MPFQIIRLDITRMEVDVIVNSANPDPIIGGGVDFAIYEAGGKELIQARIDLGSISPGDVKYTKGYQLPSKYVIHTVGPEWVDGYHHERSLLEECYRNSLLLAKELECESIAFPLISAGIFGFPIERAIKVARNEISRFLDEHEMMIYLVVFDHDAYVISKELHNDIKSYMNTSAVRLQTKRERATRGTSFRSERLNRSLDVMHDRMIPEDAFETLEDTWQESLLYWIKKKELTNPQVYKAANITKQHFSKILKDKDYHPSKRTAIAFCFALKLSLDDSIDLLEKTGYSLSLGIQFDVIIRYFLKKRKYNIFDVNEALFDFNEDPLGAVIN